MKQFNTTSEDTDLKDLLKKEGKLTDIAALQKKTNKEFVVLSSQKILNLISKTVERKLNVLIQQYTDKDKKEIEKAVRLEVFNTLKNGEDDMTSETVDLLELRILKMKKTLEATQKALNDVKSGKISQQGISSIYDCVQGLREGDDQFEAKAELLKDIFKQNLKIQEKE
ncbi:MAG: hypothetical protein V3V74_07180 [Nitrosomonadaceae bacterium]